MTGRSVRFSIRTMLAVTAVCALLAVPLRMYFRSGRQVKPFVVIRIVNSEGKVYLDGSFLGTAPVALTYEEFIAACGGDANVEVVARTPEFGPVDQYGAAVAHLRKRDGSWPIIHVAPQEGFRKIGTPYGLSALVHTTSSTGSDSHPWGVDLKLIRPTKVDVELAISNPSRRSLQCAVAVTEKQAWITKGSVKVRFGITTTNRGRTWYKSVELKLRPEDWSCEGDKFVASFGLPSLELGYYWIDGMLEPDDKSLVVPAENVFRGRVYVIPQYFVVHDEEE